MIFTHSTGVSRTLIRLPCLSLRIIATSIISYTVKQGNMQNVAGWKADISHTLLSTLK